MVCFYQEVILFIIQIFFNIIKQNTKQLLSFNFRNIGKSLKS